MAYGPLADSVPAARGWARAVLQEWGATPAGLLGDALLVVTELVSNAVVASRALPGSRPVRVWVCWDGARLLIQVGDDSTAPPVYVPASDEALSGRGLLVVDELSSGWGWFPAAAHGMAKVVWAEIRAESQPVQHAAASGKQAEPRDAVVAGPGVLARGV
jgi:anti-sigma regulatory factor (Ser/Thr protein kinase)